MYKNLADALKQREEMALYIENERARIAGVIGNELMNGANEALLSAYNNTDLKLVGQFLNAYVPDAIKDMENVKAERAAANRNVNSAKKSVTKETETPQGKRDIDKS